MPEVSAAPERAQTYPAMSVLALLTGLGTRRASEATSQEGTEPRLEA